MIYVVKFVLVLVALFLAIGTLTPEGSPTGSSMASGFVGGVVTMVFLILAWVL